MAAMVGCVGQRAVGHASREAKRKPRAVGHPSRAAKRKQRMGGGWCVGQRAVGHASRAAKRKQRAVGHASRAAKRKQRMSGGWCRESRVEGHRVYCSSLMHRQMNLHILHTFAHEIKFEPNVMCEPINKNTTFKACQLENGDTICFQKSVSQEDIAGCRFPDVPSFLEYVHDRQIVHFRRLEAPKEEGFFVELSKQHTYDDVVERVALELNVDDPTKIRLTAHNCYSQQPKPQPIKYRGVDRLSDMLVHYTQVPFDEVSDILYYEVLDIPLPELQGSKTLKVEFHNNRTEEVSVLSIRLPKQSTIGDVIDELKGKVELSSPQAELRILEVFYHKIYKVFSVNEKIENINDQYWTLRAEEIPEEELHMSPNSRAIHVYHFTRDTAQSHLLQNFGEPFFIVVHEDETLATLKERLKKKLRVLDEEFLKWKFAFVSLGRPVYLQDTDIIAGRFSKRDPYGAWEHYLGLEHTDNAPKRSHQSNQNRHAYEKSVKIYN